MEPASLRGRLSYSVGETLLSPWEAARLAPGDIVLTTREAGYPGFVLFNNLPIGIGEVIVFPDSFGVRVTDTDFRPRFQVDPGQRDALGDVLPGIVELGGFDTELASLTGGGSPCFINLGSPVDGDHNAVLRWGGFALAQGVVVVVGELMGLRITERLVEWPLPTRVLQTGSLADRPSKERAKDYDFRRPDRFSWTQIRRIAEIHRLFQRHLEGSLPLYAQLLDGRSEAMVVDQCTLREAREELQRLGLGTSVTWEHEGPRRGRRTEARSSAMTLLEAPDCPRPLTAEARRSLEALCSPHSLLAQRPVFVHYRADLGGTVGPVMADCLRNGWKKFLDFPLDAQPGTSGSSPLLEEYEMVLLVLVKRESDEPPILALVYPFLTVEPYVGLLGS